MPKNKPFDAKNEIRAIARERVGQPKARKVETPKIHRQPKHKEQLSTVLICEECDDEMHRFAANGISGYCCDSCGWSWDDN